MRSYVGCLLVLPHHMGQTLSRSRRNAFQNQRPLASLCLEYPGPCHSSSNDAKSDSMVCAGLFFRVCLPEGGKLCWCEHSLDGGGAGANCLDNVDGTWTFGLGNCKYICEVFHGAEGSWSIKRRDRGCRCSQDARRSTVGSMLLISSNRLKRYQEF